MRRFGKRRTRERSSVNPSKAEDEAAPAVERSIERAAIPSRAAVEAFEDEGECLLYNPARDQASALNRTATEVWHLCDASLTILDISEILGKRYELIDVPEHRSPGST
jgi:hypothetical protein